VSSPRIPSHIAGITPYVPGKPVEEVERELNLAGSIKLASNENPFGASPLAVDAIRRAASGVNRYPDGGGFYFKQKLAKRLGVAENQVILGNGSTEIVEILSRTFLGAEGAAVIADQAFVMYRLAVAAVNGRAKIVPLREMTHDLPAMADAITPDVKLVFIANPNNPTGTAVGRTELESFLDRVPAGVLVVLDEAYREYAEAEPSYPDGLALLREGRPLAVLRTFSKIYGLAGLRLGYALTGADVAAAVEKVRSPFNTSSLAQAAGMAALDDQEHVRISREMTLIERDFLQGELARRGHDFTPSVANFVLVRTPAPAERVFQELLRLGVIVRPMAAYNFPTSLRVTIGTRAENERFLEAFGQVLGGRSGA